MSYKDQLIMELDSAGDPLIAEVLDFLLYLKAKQFKILPLQDQERLKLKIDALSSNPRPSGLTKKDLKIAIKQDSN